MKEKIIALLNEKGLYIVLGVMLAAASVTGICMQNDKSASVIIYSNSRNDYEYSDSDISVESGKSSTKSSSGTTEKTTTTQTESSQDSSETQTDEPTQFPVDINYVTREQLMEINGIGEVTADKIINYRSEIGVIYNMDLLTDISGIGESTLALLKEYLYVSESDYRDIEEYTETQEPVQTEVTSIDTERIYTEKPSETTAAISSTTVQTTTAEPAMQCVNVNEADAEEISEKLLIDIELAQSIVEVREKIQVYTNTLELLYAKGMTESKLAELWDYIIL
ncbi:MAG: helix-hairpin-helix domain-containing protein [Ruminococcus sp.]|nr:helix-hairpin-helix domain-containing protein [Ruminococcus sp.]